MSSQYTKAQLIDSLQAWLGEVDFVNQDAFKNLDDLSEPELKKLLVVVYQAAQTEAKMDDKQKKYVSDQVQRFYAQKKMYYEQAQKDMVQHVEKLHEQEEGQHEEALLNSDVW